MVRFVRISDNNEKIQFAVTGNDNVKQFVIISDENDVILFIMMSDDGKVCKDKR